MTDFLYDPDTGMRAFPSEYLTDTPEQVQEDPEDLAGSESLALDSLQKSIEADKE